MKGEKIKVVWICHFSNSKIHKQLNVRRDVKEFAPWISLSIDLLKKRDDIELHIVAPYRWINSIKEFVMEGVYYHFIDFGIPFMGTPWPRFFNWNHKTNFKSIRKKILKIISSQNPDIVNLIGAENAYYSSSILDIKDKFPTIVTIQGFSHLNNQRNESKLLSIKGNIKSKIFKGCKKIILGNQLDKINNIEIEILKSCNNFIYQVDHTKSIIRKFNKNAKVFQNFLPTSYTSSNINIFKDNFLYDFVFFARVTKDKGIEDLIIALSIVKKTTPNVKLAVIGPGGKIYLKYLKSLAVKQDVIENIDWLGFLPTEADVHNIVARSRVTVLPTYNDIISGTIIQSMYIKTAVVAYKTGGIPDLNTDNETLKIVNQNDIKGLAQAMNELLDDDEYRRSLAERAYTKVENLFNNELISDKLREIYENVIDEYEKNH